MRSYLLRNFAIVFGLMFSQLPAQSAFAVSTADTATPNVSTTLDQEEVEKLPVTGSIDILPAQYIFVDRNVDKFRADHWMREGYSGGISDVKAAYKTPQDVEVLMEGRGILDQDEAIGRNDYFGSILIKKENLGFVDVEFKEFPKYYDNRGGVYYPFEALGLSGLRLERDLELDIGMIRVETGLTIEGWPEIEFEYERETKNGAKYRTTWGSAVVNGLTRKIVPSWQEIDEMVNVFAIKAKHEVKKFEVHGEQHFEFVKSANKRYEQNFGTTPNYNLQIQEPESRMMASTLGIDRWFWSERAYGSLAYRYADIKSSEKENLQELNSSFQRQSFSNFAEQRVDARSDTNLDSHTAVLNL